jgi:hypothetical protein
MLPLLANELGPVDYRGRIVLASLYVVCYYTASNKIYNNLE